MTGRALAIAFFAVGALAACATHAEAEPAILDSAGVENVEALTGALAKAMGVARIALGAVDLETASAIPVLPEPPSPYETKSLAAPTYFDLEIENGRCFARRRDTGERFALDAVSCRSAD